MQAVLIFILFIAVCTLMTWIARRLSRNMVEDYEFMRSQAEPRDNRQKLSDKVFTSAVGNSVVKNMVDISMLNHTEEDKDK